MKKNNLLAASALTMIMTLASIANAQSNIGEGMSISSLTSTDKVISEGGRVHLSSVNIHYGTVKNKLLVDSKVNIGTFTVKEAGKAYVSTVDLQKTNMNNLKFKSVASVNGNIDVAEGRLLNLASGTINGVEVSGSVVLDLIADINGNVEVGEGGTVLIGAVNIEGHEVHGGDVIIPITPENPNETPGQNDIQDVTDTDSSQDMVAFSQRDPRWKNMKLGNSNLTLGEYGCYVTSLAMLTGKTPAEVNKIVSAAGGFTQGGLLKNETAASALGLKYNKRTSGWKPDKDTIAEVRLNGYQHFVIWNTDGTILDPWTGRQESQSKYTPVSFRNFTS